MLCSHNPRQERTFLQAGMSLRGLGLARSCWCANRVLSAARGSLQCSTAIPPIHLRRHAGVCCAVGEHGSPDVGMPAPVPIMGGRASQRALHMKASTTAEQPTPESLLESQPSNGSEDKAAKMRNALSQGTLGLGFSAGGFLYCYHLGVLWELARLKVLPPPGHPGAIKMAGASAGSLAIVTYACGLDVDRATQALFSFANDCRTHGTRGRLNVLLNSFLHEYLPTDAHERCRDLTYVAMTRVFPIWKPKLVHQFHSKDDLVQALITSCYIPYYAGNAFMTKFRGKYYLDGGATAFIPSPPTPVTLKVCCFPVSEMLAKVQPTVQGYDRVASLLDVSISPDAFEPWAHSMQQLVTWALVPASDEHLAYLIEKGRKDARAWATSVGLVTDQASETSNLAHVGAAHVKGQGAAENRIGEALEAK